MDLPLPLEVLTLTNPPTCRGWVRYADSAIAIIKLVAAGVLPCSLERLSELERSELVVSGNVFVIKESNVRRWTDGRKWSPSRTLNQFMLYREVKSRQPIRGTESEPTSHRIPHGLEYELYGPLDRGFDFTPGGLFKKSFCAYNPVTLETYRLINYYRPDDVLQGVVPILTAPTLLPYLPSYRDESIDCIKAKVGS